MASELTAEVIDSFMITPEKIRAWGKRMGKSLLYTRHATAEEVAQMTEEMMQSPTYKEIMEEC